MSPARPVVDSPIRTQTSRCHYSKQISKRRFIPKGWLSTRKKDARIALAEDRGAGAEVGDVGRKVGPANVAAMSNVRRNPVRRDRAPKSTMTMSMTWATMPMNCSMMKCPMAKTEARKQVALRAREVRQLYSGRSPRGMKRLALSSIRTCKRGLSDGLHRAAVGGKTRRAADAVEVVAAAEFRVSISQHARCLQRCTYRIVHFCTRFFIALTSTL
jgi:hypothetical protein